MSKWLQIDVERCLHVDRGSNVILCDRFIQPGATTLVLRISNPEIEKLRRQIDDHDEGHAMTDQIAGSGRKTPGQLAYEADCALQPDYDDRDGHQAGIPRKTWDQLSAIARDSWERDPTVRARHPGSLDTMEPRG